MNEDDATKSARAREALDALLSAERDAALSPEEAAELAARLETDAAVSERQAAFASVDAGLRALGSEPLDEAALASGLARLEARMGEGASLDGEATPDRVAGRAPSRHRVARRGWGSRAAVGGLVAAAAVLALYGSTSTLNAPAPTLGAPDGPSGPSPAPRVAESRIERPAETPPPFPDSPPSPDSLREPTALAAAETPPGTAPPAREETLAQTEAFARALAADVEGLLDEGEPIALVPGIANEDLALIEELELLEFMVAREAARAEGERRGA